jgi:hypothetical protein
MSCLRGLRFGQQVSKLSGRRGVTTSWSTLATAFNSKPEPRFSITRQDVVSFAFHISCTMQLFIQCNINITRYVFSARRAFLVFPNCGMLMASTSYNNELRPKQTDLSKRLVPTKGADPWSKCSMKCQTVSAELQTWQSSSE